MRIDLLVKQIEAEPDVKGYWVERDSYLLLLKGQLALMEDCKTSRELLIELAEEIDLLRAQLNPDPPPAAAA